MSRFFKKQADVPAAHDEALSSLSRPSSPTLKKSTTSRWKKAKKQPEVRPQLDLTSVLPSADDFRTSLIMPSLSTRFSMLKEQDDPNSLLGKASDDSVIQPRRRSRLVDFGFSPNGLSDIAEVSSIHGSVRPPFAQRSREQSYVSEDGYGSDAEAHTGSVMSRSRPGEGNILFGGRQKIYKIPTTGSYSTKSLGKLVYDDDVGMSAFQKYRQKERDHDESHFPRPSNESQAFDFGLDKVELDDRDDDGQHSLPSDSAKDLSHSPSLSSYDKKRSTASSDAHSIARSSTAATSIASQPVATSTAPSPAHAPVSAIAPAPASAPLLDSRSNIKARRLYEPGLDQHIQEQQTSAITRLNSIQRQRAASGKKTPPFLHSTKSASNLQDRAGQPVYALRGQSPPLTSPIPQLNTFGSIKHAHPNTPSPAPSGPQSPIDAHFDEGSVLAQALEPGDRGKATALGAFNKPAHAFDEQQYLERQMQLQRSNSNAAIKPQPPTQSAFHQRVNHYDHEENQQQRKNSPESSTRSRSESASKKHEPTAAYSVFQNAVNQFPAKASPSNASPRSGSKSPLPDTHRTFFGNISASEDEDEDEVSEIARSFNQPEYGYGGYGRWQPTPLPSVSEHPAIWREKSKTSLAEEAEEAGLPKATLRQASSSRSLRADINKAGVAVPKDLDSPTLGPQSQGLNGMMHHIRQQSNESSVYPTDEGLVLQHDDSAPEVPEIAWDANKSDSYGHSLNSGLDPRASIRGSHYTVSNPWDLDEAYSSAGARRGDSSPFDAASASRHGRLSGGSMYGDDISDLRSQTDRERSAPLDISSWQQELRKQQHTRDPSNATMQERDAFSRELAARREAVKENLKSYHEINSRGTSPVPTATSQGPMRALNMVRAKNSRESLANLRDQPPKALKTLGVTVNGHPSVHNLVQEERGGYSFDMARPRGNSSPRAPMPPPVSQHPAFKHDIPEVDGVDFPKERQLASTRSPALSNGPNRSRSNSGATASRSHSRNGPYRDDLEKAMIEGHGSTATAHDNTSETSSAVVGSNRDSDGSRAVMQAYFDQKTGGTSARVSPNGPSSAPLTPTVYTPGRPVPVANPYTSNPTPPLSGSSQPSPATISPTAFSAAVNSPALAGAGFPTGPLRKRTILKHEISEPTFIHSTSNIDTVNLPEGASLKNGIEEPPPIPPINPRRRGTRKLFGLGSSKDEKEVELPKASLSDSNLLLHTSPAREQAHFPPSNVVRMTAKVEFDQSPAMQQYGFNATGSPERAPRGAARAVTTPMNGGMF